MAKIPRIRYKIFGESGDEKFFGQFGSYATGNARHTKDLELIQSLAAYSEGLSASTLGGTTPPALEDENAIKYLNSTMIAYLFQQGIAEWNSQTTYYKNSYVSKDLLVYRSLVDDNLNNPVTDINKWVPLVEIITSQPTEDSKDYQTVSAKQIFEMLGKSLSELETENKTIVGAINEISSKGSSGSADLLSVLALKNQHEKAGINDSVYIENAINESFYKTKNNAILLLSSYTSGTTIILKNKIAELESGNYLPYLITDDTGNFELTWITQFVSGSPGAWTYSILNPLSNNYTTANNAYITNCTGKIDLGQMTWKATATGPSAKTAKLIRAFYTGKNIEKAKGKFGFSFSSNPYAVSSLADFVNNSTIKIQGNASSEFKGNNYIVLYKNNIVNEDEDINVLGSTSGFGTSQNNWYLFKLSADSIYLEPTTNLFIGKVYDTRTKSWSNTLPEIGNDVSNYYIVRVPVNLEYCFASKTNTELKPALPSSFTANCGVNTIFSDDFTRPNGEVGNGWSSNVKTYAGGAFWGWHIHTHHLNVGGQSHHGEHGNLNGVSNIFRHCNMEIPIEISIMFKGDGFGEGDLSLNNLGVSIYSNHSEYLFTGSGILFFGGTNKITATRGKTYSVPANYNFKNNVWYKTKIQIHPNKIMCKVWKNEEDEPVNWNLVSIGSLISVGASLQVHSALRAANGSFSKNWSIKYINVQSLNSDNQRFSLSGDFEKLADVQKGVLVTTLEKETTNETQDVLLEINGGII